MALLQKSIQKFMETINRSLGVEANGAVANVDISYNEPMSLHTTFKVGGNADVWVRPGKNIFVEYAARLLPLAQAENIPVFVLGAGANTVFADSGFRGIVLDTGAFSGVAKAKGFVAKSEGIVAKSESCVVQVLSGTSIDALVDNLATQGISGLECFAGLPSSVGGAVWMNARCYEKSISDTLIETEILDENFLQKIVPFNASDFAYKKSPFQKRNVLILSASFLVAENHQPSALQEACAFYRKDRLEKGHFRFPSAGSAFKNNRDFGEPTGKIIDQLGLKGFTVDGAQIAPWHGNIVINTGNATASGIKQLMAEVARRVKAARGFALESEVLFVGESGGLCS